MREEGPLSKLNRISKRHEDSVGLCKCCSQPWPCDVQRIIRVVNELLREVH